MTIQARLADGRTLEFPDDTPPEVVDEAVKRLLGEGTAKKGLVSDLVSSTKNLVNLGHTGIGVLGGDANEQAVHGVERQKKLAREHKSGTDSQKIWDRINEGEYYEALKESGRQVPSAVASVIPSIGQSAGLAALGRVGGAAAGSFLGPAGTIAGGTFGQYALPTAVGALQALGGMAHKKAEAQQKAGEQVDFDVAGAVPYAIASGALNVAGDRLAMPSLFKKGAEGLTKDAVKAAAAKKLLDEARETAKAGLFKTAAKGIGRFELAELPTEIAQQALERAGADEELLNADAMKEYRDTATQMVLAGPLGAAGGVHNRAKARDVVQEEEAKEKAAAAAAAAKVKAEALAAETARQQTPEYAAEVEKNYLALEQKRKDLQASLIKGINKNSPTYAADKLANKEIMAELARMTKEELAPAAAAYQKVRGILAQNPVSGAPAPAVPGAPQAQTDLFGDSVAPTAEPPAPVEDTATRLGELQQQIRMLGGMEEGLKDKRTTIRGLVQERQDALAQAKNPDEVLALGAQHVESQKALDAALKEFHELYTKSNAPTESATLAGKYNRTVAAMQKALEEGDTEQAMKQAAKAKELNKDGAADMALVMVAQAKSAGTQAVVTNKWRTPAGAESTDAFNQRVVGPEMAAGREAAAAARQKVEAEIAAIQGLADKEPTTPYANEVRQEKGTQREIDAMEARRMETGRTDQLSLLDKAPPLQSRVVRGISLGGEGPTGALTAGIATKPPRQVEAKQDAAISMGQSLAQLLQATPEDVESAQGRVLERLATDIEATTGKPLPQSARYALAAEARPVLEALSQSAKRMTDARKAQRALDAIRNRRVPTDPGAAVDTAYTPDTTSEEALNEQLDRAIAAKGTAPEQRALLEQVVDNLPAVQANPERRNMVADWLHQDLGVAPRTGTERQADVAQALDTLEGGKRSETEQAGGETRTAVQADMFPQEQYQGKMFATPQAFEAYLGGEALHRMRLLMGKTVQTLSRATRLVAPLRRRAEELRKNVARLQQTWVEQEAIGADNMDAATQAHEAARARLQAAIDNVNDALRPLTDDLNRAQAEFDATTANSKEISALIAANTANMAKFKGPALVAATEAWSSAVADFEQASRAVTTPGPESVTIDAALKAHAKVLAAAKKQNTLLQKDVGEKAMLAFMQKDLNYQMQLADELGHVFDAVHNLTAAQMELDMAQEDLMRQPGVKSDLSARKGVGARTANAREALRKSNDAKLRETSQALYAGDSAVKGLEREIAAVLGVKTKAPKEEQLRRSSSVQMADSTDDVVYAQDRAVAAALRTKTSAQLRREATAAAPGETQADREYRDADARKVENERMETLADLPGLRVTHEAYRKALERLESAPARVAELQTKAADTTLPKTTRDKARRQELQLEREVKLASGMLSHSGEDMAQARQQATDALVALRDKVEAKRESAAEEGIAKSTADSRRRELGKLQRQAASLARLVNSLNNQAEVTPLETSDTRRAAAEDRAAELYLERAVNLETLGTTGKLPARKIGPLVRNQVTAGNVRTGDLDTVDERNLPSTNKIKQAGKTRGITGTQAVRAAAKDTAHEQAMLELSKIEDLQERNSDALALAQEAGDEALIAKYEAFATRLEAGHAKASTLVQRGNETAAKAAEFEGGWEASDDAGYGVAADNVIPHIVRSKPESKPESKPVSASDLADGTDAREAHLRSIAPGIEFDTASPLHGKTYAEAARSAAKNPSSPAIGAILNKLADLLERAPNTDMTGRVYVMSKPGKLTKAGARKMSVAEGSPLNPHYDPEKDYALVISDGLATAANRLDDVNLAHELAHVATVRGLLLNTPESEALRKELDVLLNTIKAWVGTKKGKAWLTENWRTEAFAGNLGKDGLTASAEAWHKVIYGLTDIMELLADGLSNHDFQKLLSQIRTGPGKPNLLSRFFAAVTDYLGFTLPAHRTALHDLLSLADQVTAETERTFAQPALWRDTPNKYNPVIGWQTVQYDANRSPLSLLAQRNTAKKKSLWDSSKGLRGLIAKTAMVDYRAPVDLAATLAQDTDDVASTQFKLFMRLADKTTELLHATISEGAPILRKDEKGIYLVEMSGGTSLQDVLKAVAAIPDRFGDAQDKMDVVTQFLNVQRVLNKKATHGEMGLQAGEAEAVTAQVNADPELHVVLKDVRTKMNEFTGGMLRFVGATGRLPKAVVEEMLADGDYVPRYEAGADGNAYLHLGAQKINMGDIRRQPFMRELKDGQGPILPINESLMRNTAMLMNMGMKNLAAKSGAYMYQSLGAGTIYTGDGPAKPTVLRFYEEPDPADENDTGKRYIDLNTADTVLEGIPNEMLMEAMEGTTETAPGLMMKLAVGASNLLRSGITRLPLYVERQLTRDPMIAVATGGLNKNMLSAVVSAHAEFAKQSMGTSDGYQKLLRQGLVQSQIWTGDSADLAKLALQIGSGKDLGALNKAFALADRAAMRADSSTRALLHKGYIEQGLSEGEAQLQVIESMNFSKRGASHSLQAATRLLPFSTAQIQALNVLYTSARGKMPMEEKLKIQGKFFNQAMLLFGTGLLYAAMMEDDETYRNARARDRMLNWFIPSPFGGPSIKVPIPFEFGYFFSAAVALMDSLRDDVDGEQIREGIYSILRNSIPGGSTLGIPQIAAPTLGALLNTNLFTLDPLVSTGKQRLSPEEQYNNNTTEAAKWLSRQLPAAARVSPIKIEHWVDNTLGKIPVWVAGMANDLFLEDTGAARPDKAAHEMPVVGGLFQRKQGNANVNRAWDRADAALKVERTYNSMRASGRPEATKRYLDENVQSLRMAGAAHNFESVMKGFSEREKAIRRSGRSGAEMREALDVLDTRKNLVAQNYLNMLRRLEDAAV